MPRVCIVIHDKDSNCLEIIYGGATLLPDKRIYMSHCRLQIVVPCNMQSCQSRLTRCPHCPGVPVSTWSHAPDLRRNSVTCPCPVLATYNGPHRHHYTTFRPLNSQEAGVRPAAVCSQVKTERVMCGVESVQQPCNDVGEAPCPTWPQSRSRVKLSINIYTYL